MPLRPPRALLFDLDGTLADTAPDLAAAANYLRQQRGLENAPYESLRPVASAMRARPLTLDNLPWSVAIPSVV